MSRFEKYGFYFLAILVIISVLGYLYIVVMDIVLYCELLPDLCDVYAFLSIYIQIMAILYFLAHYTDVKARLEERKRKNEMS